MDNEYLPFQSEDHYRRLRTKLVAFFDRRRCNASEDLADDTLARLMLRAASLKGIDPDPVAFGIARNVYREWVRKAIRETSMEDDPADDPTPVSSSFRSVAEACVGALNAADRDLLEEYFIDGKTAKDLAPRLRITAVAVRGRIFRLRRGLELSIAQMMAAVTPAPVNHSNS